MKKIFLIIILLALFGLTFFPNLVECNGTPPKELSELEAEITRIVTFVQTDIVPAVGGFALAITGILFMFSGASPQLHDQAKQALIYIVIGIIVILGASELVSAVVGG